ncbi:PhzF family phenazine biosynthesis protein [Undibacterium pigrum]|uniref:PhzF family phenazine biosynthesis protein n=1 Tax=Undibacterium pigrum TaxID=401470 RepID=A0A318J008_9BURK|nr:PhzF family phenazine biosynthesis protein [Undibacterium pigrum]PXX37258.1 PhzF family phenazine biosynthesis protein [Undibacterium pigrum]
MVKPIEVHIVHAFTQENEGGNPAGVVLNADSYTTEQKLQIARAVGLSETAFVSNSDCATYKLEFFTPNRQIAHCGHATVATFSLLRELGKVSEGLCSKQTIDGNRDILIKGELAFMQQSTPRYQSISADDSDGFANLYERILQSMGLTEHDLLRDRLPSIINTGNAFLAIPIIGRECLANIQPDHEEIGNISEELDLVGFYPFTLDVQDNSHAASTRMFAPRYGIGEEAATGTAAGPLACLLYTQYNIPGPTFQIEQGVLMEPASPSLIKVELEIHKGQIPSLMVGGRARVAKTMAVRI